MMIFYKCEIIGGELTTEFVTEYEKDYQKGEWIDIKDLEAVNFNSTIDLKKVINEAVRI